MIFQGLVMLKHAILFNEYDITFYYHLSLLGKNTTLHDAYVELSNCRHPF